MTDDEFVKAVGIDKIKMNIADSNLNYQSLVKEYVDDNSPCKIGTPYVLDDIGVRIDYANFKKKNRAFIVLSFIVDYKPDGSPLIIAGGYIYVNGDHCKKDEDIVGTFRCIVHGSMGEVKFKHYTK